MNPKKYFIVTLIFVVSLFYWLEIRPRQIRIECSKKAIEGSHYETSNQERDDLQRDIKKIDAIETERTNNWYYNCIHEKGLSD